MGRIDWKDIVNFLAITVIILLVVLFGIQWLLNSIISGGNTVTASDLLGISSIAIALVTLVSSIFWNLWLFKRTGDQYVPIPVVGFEGLQSFCLFQTNEMLLTITNIGLEDLVPKFIEIICPWETERIKIEDFTFDMVCPAETEHVTVVLPSPTPGNHTIIVAIEAKGYSWRRPTKITVLDLTEMEFTH